MKQFLFLLVLLGPVSPLFAQSAPTVRCPLQSRSEKRVNHIFFSFYKKESFLGNHIPRNLVLVDPALIKGGFPRCLTKKTVSAFTDMNTALQKDTGTTLMITSAWRSKKTQQYFATSRPEFSAVPGRSEHQLGTTVDIHQVGVPDEVLFKDTPAYVWMTEHAHLYGFVQSFIERDFLITGVPEEPWHWRFVGSTIATKVKGEQRNLNEYLYERSKKKKKIMQ